MGFDISYLITWHANYVTETRNLARKYLEKKLSSEMSGEFRHFLNRLVKGDGETKSSKGGMFAIGGVTKTIDEDCEPLATEVVQFFKELWEINVHSFTSILAVILYQPETDQIKFIQIEYPDRMIRKEFDGIGVGWG